MGQRTPKRQVRRQAAKAQRRAERSDGIVDWIDLPSRSARRLAQRERDAGRWALVRRGVNRVVGAPTSWDQAARAAALAGGELVYVSHEAAARLYGIDGFGRARLEVSAPLTRKVRLAGIRAHRIGTLEEGDIRVHQGVRIASPIRIVLDLSSRLDLDRLGRLVDDLLRSKLLSLEALRDRVARTRPAPGRSVRKLRAVLAGRSVGFDAGQSTLEARIRRVLDRYGFPPPVHQHRVETANRSYSLDFSYPDQMLFLEGDGFGFHSFASDLDNDHRRQNELVVAGWTPLRFTWRMKDAEIVATLDAFYDRAAKRWKR